MRQTDSRVIAKRLRDVCGLPEDEQLWKTGRGFGVPDLVIGTEDGFFYYLRNPRNTAEK